MLLSGFVQNNKIMNLFKILYVTTLFSSLSLLFLGGFYGRIQIYTYESDFWRALLDNGGSLEMIDSYMKYINIFKDQWNILFYFGIFQILVLLIVFFLSRKASQKDRQLQK